MMGPYVLCYLEREEEKKGERETESFNEINKIKAK